MLAHNKPQHVTSYKYDTYTQYTAQVVVYIKWYIYSGYKTIKIEPNLCFAAL